MNTEVTSQIIGTTQLKQNSIMEAKATMGIVRATLPWALNVFEGAWLTQLIQVVTAGRLFLIHKGQVNP